MIEIIEYKWIERKVYKRISDRENLGLNLFCTELMARGVDFKAVNCVINYDFPQTTASYIHRIGRTGRANRKGHAYTLFTDQDCRFLKSIANVMKLSGCDVPNWMLDMKKLSLDTYFILS